MTITLSQFITAETGQAVSYDNVPANTGQCEQLVQEYCVQVLDWTPPIIPSAVEWWTNPTVLANFAQIPIGQLQAGDIVVFGANADINSPVDGHIDICAGSVISSGYQGFDSNWEPLNLNAQGYPTAHLVNHSYTDVLGGLRYNEAMTPTSTQVGQEFQALANRQPTQAEVDLFIGLNWFDGLQQYLFPGVEQTYEQIANLEAERDNTLYPFVNAVCADLNIPITTDITTVATAITALQKAGTPLNAANVETYIQEHLS